MIDQNILGNPLFQLNLALFLTWPTHSSSQIEPIFYDAGYNLSYIEKALVVPQPAVFQFEAVGVEANRSVSPEAILERSDLQVFIPIECKRSSFGVSNPTASQVKQALGMLTLTGKIIATQLGKTHGDQWTEILTYITRQGQGTLLLATLQELSKNLTDFGIEPAKTATLELSYTGTGIEISSVNQSALLPGVDLSKPRQVIRLYNDEDPRPLYLIPYIPGGQHERDAISEQEFHERVRVAAASFLFSKLDRHQHEYDLDDMMAYTIQVWKHLADAKIKHNIRAHASNLLRDLFMQIESETKVRCFFKAKSRMIIIPAMSAEEAKAVRKHVSKVFRRTKIDFTGPAQGSLFDLLPDE